MKILQTKKLTAFILCLVMVLSMMPGSLLTAIAESAFENDTGNNGWEWVDNTLYIKDGKITKGELYNALVEKYGSGSYKYAASKPSWGWGTGGTEVTANDTASITVTEGNAAAGKKGRIWSSSTDYTFTVKYYYAVTTAVAEGSPAGAGISVATKNVVKGTTVKVTVNNVNGYTASVTDSKGNAVTNLDAYAPTESTTLTVTYTSVQVAKYNVTVNTVNGSYGTATLKSEAELPAGAEALVEATPKGSDGNHKYEIESVKVGDTVLSKNANGYYVYTMGETDVTITVTFKATTLEQNDTIGKVSFDTSKTVSAQLADLKKAIFEAVVNSETSLPEGITVDDVNIQYIPWYKGNITANYEHDGVATDLTASPAGMTLKTGYSFGALFAEGMKDTERVVITGKGTWANLSLTVDITLENTNVLELNENPAIEINGYSADTIMGGLKGKILNAVLKNGYTNIADYTVYVYCDVGTEINLGALMKLPSYVNIEDSDTLNWVSEQVDKYLDRGYWLEPGDTLKVKIVDKRGVSVETEVKTSESRKPANVSLGSFEKKQNTLSDFETAILNAINVTNSTGTSIKSNAGLTITLNSVEGKVNTYTVSYNVANSGETWLATSGTFAGEVVWEVKVYNVTFKNDDGSVLSENNYPYGTTADKVVVPTTPTKANEVDANGTVIARYTFAGWNPEIDTVTGEAIYTATYNRVVEKYTITFVDGNGNTVQSTEVEYGATPEYTGATPTKTATEQYTYTFKGWDKEIVAVTGAATYTAQFDSTVNKYTVTFVDGNGNTVQSGEVEYGTVPTYTGATPTKTATAQCTYTFTGWDKEIVAVTGAVTYTAQFNSTVNEYTVTFKNEDGTELQSGKVAYGIAPTYTGATPTKAATAQYTYTFKGWDKEIAAVTGDVVYTATFTATVNKYTVTFEDGNGNTVKTEEVEYGKTVSAPENPSKEGYNFAYWAVNGAEVTFPYTVVGNVTITAEFTQLVAKVGETLYETLAEAIAAAQAGDTVILLADNAEAITVDKNLTLDLNGNEMTGKITLVPGVALTTPKKNLDIVDGQNYPGKTQDNYITKYENGAYTRVEGNGGTWGGIDWTLDADGTLTIAPTVVKATKDNSGKWQYTIGQWPETVIYNSNGGASSIGGMPFSASAVKKLIIKEGVTSIGSFSAKFPNVTDEVIIPWTVTYIGQEAFQGIGASKITFQKVPEGKEQKVELCIAAGAFKNIVVTEFAFPDDRSVHLHVWTLINAKKLEHVYFPSTITSVTNYKHVDYYHNPDYNASGSVNDSTLLNGWKDGAHQNPAMKAITYGSEDVKNLIESNGNSWIKNNFNAAHIGLTYFISVEAAIEYALENCEGGTRIELPGALPENVNIPNEFKVVVEDGVTYIVKKTIYTVDWIGADGTHHSVEVMEGEAINATVADPTRIGYTFAGWDKEVPATMPEANVTITAKWTINQYTVSFDSNGGTTVETITQDYGSTVTLPAAPTKVGHTFKGWKVVKITRSADTIYQPGDTFTLGAENVQLVAVWEINKYTVTFVDGNGNTIQSGEWEYNTVPSYTGATPTKTATAQYTYTFKGWDKAFAAVTEDVTYTAQFNATVNKYTVTFKNWDGTVLQTGKVEYGTVPTFNGATPTRPVANDIKYTFAGWDTEVVAVNGDVTYTAQYNSELNASNGTVAINGYYESKQDQVIFDTLKADVLKAAGLTGKASDYTVKVNLRGSLYDLDKMTGLTNIFNWEAFFLAVEVPESGRQFEITHSSGASKTVTMKIVDSRPNAGLVNKEITEVKVLDKNDNPTDYINTLLAQVNPNGLNVTVTLTEGTWPPAQAGVTYKYVYTVSYKSDANWIGGSATLTVYMQSLLNNCTVVPGSSLTAGGSLTVNGSNDNTTVAGNSTVSITVKPSGSNVVETITVYKNGVVLATFNTNQISYSSKNATVSFNSDGTEIADVYTVEVTYSQNYLNLVSGTIKYCMDLDNLNNNELKVLVFGGIFGGSSAPMNAGNVTLEYAYIGVGGYNLWQDISKGPAINIGSLTHKFGEDGTETIRIKYSDDKYGSFEQTVVLNVFDSCYSSTVVIQTIAGGEKQNFSVKYSEDARKFEGVSYFKAGNALTVTLTPDGDDILGIIGQIYNKTYTETSPYIKSVKVMKYVDGQWVEVASTLERGTGELIDWDNILGGIGNPAAYTASVTFTPEADTQYKVVAEYGVLTLERSELSAQMLMYQAGAGYVAEVPSAQEIVDKFLGKDYAANFIATYGGAWTVEFTTDVAQSTWTEVTDENLLALYDGTKVRIRITWNPTEDDKTYYPVAVSADLTLVDLRTATNVQGSVPTTPVEYVEEAQLIANLKKAMSLGILANGALIDVEYDVNYTIEVLDHGNFATVIVTYHGSENYKSCQRTFKNVPVADIPDNSTIKVTISGAAVNVTNQAGTAMNWDPSTELYTVIGNGTYNFTLTPAEGKAIEAVKVFINGVEQEVVIGKTVTMSYKDGVATFSLYLEEKNHYEIVVETVDSAWGLEDEPTYDFAYGVQTPVAGDIVEQITKYPTDIDFSKVVLEYLAREEGKVTITLPNIDLGFTNIELGTFDIELGELWAPVGTEVTEYDLEKLADELVAEVIEKIGTGEVGITDAYSYIENKLKTLTLGAHAFGSEGDGSTETIRFSYADDKYTLAEVVTDVTIHDNRIATEIIANDCEVTYGYSLEDLIAAAGAGVFAEGVLVDGLKIDTKDLYLHAGTHTITLFFAGDETYQHCKVTINVTVNKATVSIDYDSQFITYGDDYKFNLFIAPDYFNDGTKVDPELIEFLIGLDTHALLTFNPDKDNNLAIDGMVGLDQAIGFIQLRLPETIRELPLVGEYLQGEFTLSQFTELINQLSDTLGIDENSIEILNQVVEAITGITDRMDIKVIISDKEFHPTNMGVYIAGAVTIDSDYETAYTADYLIIAPQTNEVELGWDTPIDNYLTTLPVWNTMDKGASIVGDPVKDFAIKNIILGLNSDDNGILSTDIYGKIKANIWLNPEDVKDNGVYVQIAVGAKWGNELYYAIPIVRAFAIVPGTVNVELVGSNGTPNDELLKEFNNMPQGFGVIVKDSNGNVIYSDHYQNIVKLPDNAQIVVRYIGVQSNGTLYNSTEKPVHAGVYTVYVVYVQTNDGGKLVDLENIENINAETLYELFDLNTIGADVALLVIEPTDSTVDVEDVIVTVKPGESYNPKDQVEAGSTVNGLKPDTTIITAGIASNGMFTQNGWDAINGTVNVDFPRWIDELIAKYAPSIVSGITVADLNSRLTAKLPEILAALEAEGATAEVINSLTNAFENVSDALAKLPANTTVSFRNDITYTNVGAYVIIAVVTDSDHYPSVDYGFLVITPDVENVDLKWNYVDENGVFTTDLLKHIDLYAKAFNVNDGAFNEGATNKITYQFIGFDANGEFVIYDGNDVLPNGAYIELAYIEFELDGKIYISDMIARPVVILPSNCKVEVEELITEFDNTEKVPNITIKDINGNVIDSTKGQFTFIYAGLQTNGQAYLSDKAPVHAGVYEVIVIYVENDDNGNMRYYGVGVSGIIIDMTDSTIDVTGGTVEYDGNGHTANVVPGSNANNLRPDYTLISGGAWITGDINSVGINDLHGNVNIDFPKWFDAVIAETEAFQNGVTPAYLIRFINSYRDGVVANASDALAKIGVTMDVDKLNAYIDELLSVLAQMPADVTLTFIDNITYTETGYYFYYGIVTDSDHYPSADTGILNITPAEITSVGATDTVYNGTEQTTGLTVIGVNGVVLTEGVDFVIVSGNKETNAGTYTVTIEGIGNYTGTYTVEWTIAPAKLTVTLDDITIHVGSIIPELSWTIDGLVNGDTADMITVIASHNGTNSVAGKYIITAIAENNNYTITVVNGKLTVKDHVKGDVVVENAKAPTCTQEGSYDNVTYCTVCGEETSRTTITVNATGHTAGSAVAENIVAPTCTSTGSYDNVIYCIVCGEEISREPITVEKVDHKTDRVVVENVVAPTCTADGSYDNVTYCACGYEISRTTITVNATGHTASYVVVENIVAPTCTAEGSYDNVTYCACGKEISRETIKVAKIEHKANKVVVENVEAPTCTKEGSYDNVTYCTVCDKEISRETISVAKIAHTYNAVVTAPTCEAEGYTTYTCDCGNSYTAEYVNALGHNYVGAVTKAPTCTEKGEFTYTCQNDASHTYTEEIAVLAHIAGSAVVENAKAPTCTATGSYDNVIYCIVCGEEISRETITVEKVDHKTDRVVVENAKAPTCTQEGSYDNVTYCACNYEISRVTIIVAKIAHTYNAVVTAPTCEAEGYTTYTCNCGNSYTAERVNALGHNYVGVVTKAPTCTEKGVITYTCQNDASHTYTEEIAMLAHVASDVKVENIKAPTCTVAGSYDNVTYCACGTAISRTTITINATGHTAGSVVVENVIAPTCTATGSYDNVTYCAVCNAELSRTAEVVAALGHNYVTEVIAPTCTTDGYTVYRCIACDHVYVDNYVDALGHKAGNVVVENEIGPNASNAGSYDNVVYCTVCGEELSRETVVSKTVLTVNGIHYSSWADAKDSIKKNSQIKLYANVEYGIDENNKKVEHKFLTNGGNIVIDLNGFDLTFHHTVTVQYGTVLTVTDTSNGEAGNLITTAGSYPFVINGKSSVNLSNGVGFDGTMQFQNLANGNKAYFQINGENIIGTDNSMFVTSGSTVRLALKDNYMSLALITGELTLTEDLATLAGQKITLNAGTTLTIADNVTLTLDPASKITINGTVNGEGTVVVNSAEHLKQVLEDTTVANIKLGSDIDTDVVVSRDVTLDLNGKILTGDVTVTNGKLTVKDSVVDESIKNYTAAGYVNGAVSGDMVLYAGTYNYDVTDLCADGYIAVPNAKAAGTWTVMKGILTVDGVPYDSWADAAPAINAVAKGDTCEIVFYKDVTIDNYIFQHEKGTTYNINLNGNDMIVTNRLGCASQTIVNIYGEGEIIANGDITVNSDTVLKLAETVDFEGNLTFNGHAVMGQLYVGDRCWIGTTADAVFTVTDGTLQLKLVDNFMEIYLKRGHVTLNEDLDTLADQIVSIKSDSASAPSTLTVAEDVTLTIHPETEIEIGRNGFVNGEGTIVVSTAEHLDIVLDTQIANVVLASNVDGNVEANGTTTLDLNGKTINGTMTVNGKLVIKDSTVDPETKEEFLAAGKVTGMITVADNAELVLYAGTYNADMFSNTDMTSNCADGYVAQKNADGTWTVMTIKASDYVCWNTDTGVYYTDASDGLAVTKSDETLELLKNVEEALVYVLAGTTFNLNGHYITAGNVLSFGDVIDNNDTSDGLGGIVITNDRTKAFVQLQQNNTYLPLYDADNGCYRFYAYTVSLLSYKVSATDAITFRYRIRLSTADAYRLLADSANSGIEFNINVAWTGLVAADSLSYNVSGDKISQYANEAYEQVVNGEKTAMTVNKTIEFTIFGLDAFESGTVITATPSFSSETGVVAERNDLVDRYTSYTYISSTVSE